VRLRTSCVLALTLAETGALLVIWQAFRDATHGMQHMSNVIADHRCRPPSSPIDNEHYPYVAGAPLVQPAPMADPAIARNPHTLGRSQ
jgi:hypothetical protein